MHSLTQTCTDAGPGLASATACCNKCITGDESSCVICSEAWSSQPSRPQACSAVTTNVTHRHPTHPRSHPQLQVQCPATPNSAAAACMCAVGQTWCADTLRVHTSACSPSVAGSSMHRGWGSLPNAAPAPPPPPHIQSRSMTHSKLLSTSKAMDSKLERFMERLSEQQAFGLVLVLLATALLHTPFWGMICGCRLPVPQRGSLPHAKLCATGLTCSSRARTGQSQRKHTLTRGRGAASQALRAASAAQ